MQPTQVSGWRVSLLAALVMASLLLAPLAQAQNPRYAGIVIDTDTHEILYAENADAPRYPASLTKMMTLYLLFEALDGRSMSLGQPLPVSRAAAAMPATKLYLKPGESIPVEKAIESLIVTSANDVAVVVAEALGGSERHFAEMMTREARELGMRHTVFRNASGLPDNAQVTTARDMAILARRLMLDFPEYYHYFSLQQFTWRGRVHRGHNRLLANYPGADGLKTGFIRASGFNVATSAVHNGRRMLSVVMGGFTAASRDEHMADLLNRGFTRASLADGHGWLARTEISNEKLMALPGRTLPPAGQRLASRDGSASASAAFSASASPSSTSSATRTPEPASASAPGPVVQEIAAPSPDETIVAAAPSVDATADGAGGQGGDPLRTLIDRDDAVGGDWGVQVGAFSDADHARRLADRAAARLATEMADARVEVPWAENAGVYRARLVDLGERQARNACQRLQSQGMDCMVVQASL
ncbi:D-alanyl-D-alanine carboxypeptidase family protein [Halomonas getboli]|uniref:D-alanyl-D-alanine carboxypeptidase family protein n=1 Tax=Halomonas getboli TaxID=2935862 RepID=UPI001FFFB980|nr:D-alanyl-D-alanine carboxypeptidase family protein [Halomonas getboli]MCK2185170.1 D-alanyl-D-alanine carboxypeptidase [Halomonas getboli]